MKDKLNFYINGQWVESDSKERIEIINPANEELIGHVTSGTKEISIKQYQQHLMPFKHINLAQKKIALIS